MGLLVAVVCEIPKAHAFVREGRWKTSDYPLSRNTLRNRKVGMYGMGRIGRCIARRIEAFGLPVAYYSRRPADDVAYDYCPLPSSALDKSKSGKPDFNDEPGHDS